MSAVAVPNPASENTASSWEQLRADEEIQFAPIDIPVELETEPNFIERFFRWLGEIIADSLGPVMVNSWPILKLVGKTASAKVFFKARRRSRRCASNGSSGG